MSRARKQAVQLRKGSGLKIRRMPDIDLNKKMASFVDPEPPRAEAPLLAPAVAAASLETPERLATLEASKLTRELITRDADYDALFRTLVAFRRAYSTTYRELQVKLEQEKAAWPAGSDFPQVEDFMLQCAAFEAAKPFSEHTLMEALLRTALPWLMQRVDTHTAADAENDKADRDAENAKREARPVPLPFIRQDMASDSLASLDKKESMVIVGWRNAVLWLLDQILAHAAGAVTDASIGGIMTAYMADSAPRPGLEDGKYLARLGPSSWQNCAASPAQLACCMGAHVADKLSAPLELLVCADLAKAYTGGFVGRPEAARAGDAHKIIRRWCDVAKTAFMGGVCLPQPQDAVDLSGHEYDQLRAFTLLLPLTNTPEPDEGKTYRLTLGNGLASWDVPAEVLGSYGSLVRTS